jgi:SpoVK/Ycf46/Vps4 family AAA+-type ATPase
MRVEKTLQEIATAVRTSPERSGTALFVGEAHKATRAAAALAERLGLTLHRVDLGAVVGKYIGETEKNLDRVFASARESGALLLFDEADALFGKRSEVKDSHDRYANAEIDSLLKRMEAYAGLAILATNSREAADTLRSRIRYLVELS